MFYDPKNITMIVILKSYSAFLVEKVLGHLLCYNMRPLIGIYVIRSEIAEAERGNRNVFKEVEVYHILALTVSEVKTDVSHPTLNNRATVKTENRYFMTRKELFYLFMCFGLSYVCLQDCITINLLLIKYAYRPTLCIVVIFLHKASVISVKSCSFYN